jgi:hypothetical protein
VPGQHGRRTAALSRSANQPGQLDRHLASIASHWVCKQCWRRCITEAIPGTAPTDNQRVHRPRFCTTFTQSRYYGPLCRTNEPEKLLRRLVCGRPSSLRRINRSNHTHLRPLRAPVPDPAIATFSLPLHPHFACITDTPPKVPDNTGSLFARRIAPPGKGMILCRVSPLVRSRTAPHTRRNTSLLGSIKR